VTDDWYAASLMELKALLDRVGEKGYVTLRPGDAAVAAIIAQLSAASVLAATAQHVYEAKATLALLEVL
jgi:hypothetical protein